MAILRSTMQGDDAARAAGILLPVADGRYELGSEIARGGMGTVLEAEDSSLQRRVAIKMLLDPDSAPDDRLYRFLAEARITGQLEHPGIVPVYELATDPDGRLFYAMKLVRGTTLADILARIRGGDKDTLAKYPLGALLTAFLKICDAVAFAHSRGVIHRDLKPANVMVGEYGEVLVMDWGLAKFTGSAQHGEPRSAGVVVDQGSVETIVSEGDNVLMTLEGQILGTPAYMAPEQARGEISSIDARTDVYALGAILYAILVLRPPVEGTTTQEVLDNVLKGNLTPPSTHNSSRRYSSRDGRDNSGRSGRPGSDRAAVGPVADPLLSSFPHCPGGRIPEPLSLVAMKALAWLPLSRYGSVMELQADIEAWRTGYATAAEKAGLGRQFALLVRRHRVAAAAALAVALSLVSGLAATSVQWRRAVAGEKQALSSEARAVDAEAQRRDTALAAARRFAMQAIRSAETGRWEEAQRRAGDAAAVSPDGPWALYAAGVFMAIRKDYAGAGERFREALRVDPGHAESAAGLAEALSREGRLAEAVALAAGAVDVADWRALFSAGKTLYEGGRLRECQPPLERGHGPYGGKAGRRRGATYGDCR